MELTEVEFWEDYWKNCKLPSKVDMDFSFDRCLAQGLKKNIPEVKGDVFEVGCAPGRWLAFMAKEFGLNPNGIEYSEAGMNATLENFKLLGVTPGLVLTGNFFEVKLEKQFDVVMSFGFIEHFSEVDKVVELHLKWLKPGGILILGVPNFCGIYYYLQRILDVKILDKHNLSIMNHKYFSSLAERFGLKPVFLGYLGSFEPALLIPRGRVMNPFQFIVKGFIWLALRIRKIKILDSINNRLISSYILAIYKKGENN